MIQDGMKWGPKQRWAEPKEGHLSSSGMGMRAGGSRT